MTDDYEPFEGLMPNPLQPFYVWDPEEETFPCKCCSPAFALERHWREGPFWVCRPQRTYWREVDELPVLWADLIEADERAALGALSAEERAARAKAEEVARARAEADREVDILANKASQYAMDTGIRSRCKGAVLKKDCPCKQLYWDESRKRHPTDKAPLVPYVASACWAWEYTNPKTGKKEAPRTCPFSHPGEPTWLPQWTKDRMFRPGQGAAAPGGTGNRFEALSGAAGGAPRTPPSKGRPPLPPAPRKEGKGASRWSALEEDD